MFDRDQRNPRQSSNYSPAIKIVFDFYTEGKLNLSWLDEKARDFSEEKIGRSQIKYSQIRTFYDEFLTMKAMPFEGEEFNEKVIPLLKLLKAKIVNRQNRKVLDPTRYFMNFIIELVDSVTDKETLGKACMIFEAVAGYFPKLNN